MCLKLLFWCIDREKFHLLWFHARTPTDNQICPFSFAGSQPLEARKSYVYYFLMGSHIRILIIPHIASCVQKVFTRVGTSALGAVSTRKCLLIYHCQALFRLILRQSTSTSAYPCEIYRHRRHIGISAPVLTH